MSALEDRYRRLLCSYPADHRRSDEDEMLGVLLAAAEPGRTRPALRDALDLVRGGLTALVAVAALERVIRAID